LRYLIEEKVNRMADQDTMKMISILASIVRFVLADLTEAESAVPAFPFILPDFPSIPVQPRLQISKHETPMLSNISRLPGFSLLLSIKINLI